MAEWQTHQLEVLAMATLCGFKSHPSHQAGAEETLLRFFLLPAAIRDRLPAFCPAGSVLAAVTGLPVGSFPAAAVLDGCPPVFLHKEAGGCCCLFVIEID